MALIDQLYPRSVASLIVEAVVIAILASVSLAVYRLYLSPIANFPGPKLAAVTGWHETYYDCVLGGKFVFAIEDMHKKYGTAPSSLALSSKLKTNR